MASRPLRGGSQQRLMLPLRALAKRNETFDDARHTDLNFATRSHRRIDNNMVLCMSRESVRFCLHDMETYRQTSDMRSQAHPPRLGLSFTQPIRLSNDLPRAALCADLEGEGHSPPAGADGQSGGNTIGLGRIRVRIFRDYLAAVDAESNVLLPPERGPPHPVSEDVNGRARSIHWSRSIGNFQFQTELRCAPTLPTYVPLCPAPRRSKRSAFLRTAGIPRLAKATLPTTSGHPSLPFGSPGGTVGQTNHDHNVHSTQVGDWRSSPAGQPCPRTALSPDVLGFHEASAQLYPLRDLLRRTL